MVASKVSNAPFLELRGRASIHHRYNFFALARSRAADVLLSYRSSNDQLHHRTAANDPTVRECNAGFLTRNQIA